MTPPNKTMFAADSAFESMLKKSSLNNPIDSAVKKKTVPEKARTKKGTASAEADKYQLNVYVDPKFYYALSLKKAKAKILNSDSDKTFVGIVEAALSSYLADELRSAPGDL